MAKKTNSFILSDDSLNRYGFRILTSGIQLDSFMKNPLMFYMHKRDSEYKDEDRFPIGTWENIRVEDGKLLADPKFDESDELAMKVKQKVEAGILKMASVGFDPIEFSDDPEMLVPGQTRLTVSKCEILEASIVDIGANRNAFKLYKSGKVIELSADSVNDFLPELNLITKTNTMKKIAIILSLAENADENAIETAVKNLISKNQENASALSAKDAEILRLNTQIEDANKLKVKTLIDQAVLDKKITEGERETYEKLAKSDFELASKLLGTMKGVEKVIDTINTPSGDSKLTWDDLHKEGKLESIKVSNFPQFKQLYFDKFNKEYKA